MKKRLIAILLGLSLAGAAFGATALAEEKSLTAEEAYEQAVNTAEESECTDDECVVTLYDDDGELLYSVVSPLGFKRG